MDEATLRKAVDLAEGWEFDPAEDDEGWIDECGEGVDIVGLPGFYWKLFWEWPPEYRQPYIDALAMQLARQVDAISRAQIDIDRDGVIVRYGSALTRHNGPNRAENIINAAVDSGVLDK